MDRAGSQLPNSRFSRDRARAEGSGNYDCEIPASAVINQEPLSLPYGKFASKLKPLLRDDKMTQREFGQPWRRNYFTFFQTGQSTWYS